MEWHEADCVSGYVFQEMSSLGEQFIVPATYIMSAMVLPLWLIAALPAPGLSFAVGQVIVFRREAFEAIGGYARVRAAISDDLAIARELKRAGFREVSLDMRRHVRCRMYQGYRASFNGLSKNIYDLARHRSVFFAAAVSLLAAFVVLPLALLPIQLLTGNPAGQLTVVCVLLFLVAWALVLYDRGLKWWIPLLYPVLSIHLLYMAWWCLSRAGAGRGRGLERKDPEVAGWRTAGETHHPIHPGVHPFHGAVRDRARAVRVVDWLLYRISIEGRENLRGLGRAILVSNHTLLLDPGLIAHAIRPRRTYFTMLEETALIPFLGTFVRLLGGVPIPAARILSRWRPRRARRCPSWGSCTSFPRVSATGAARTSVPSTPGRSCSPAGWACPWCLSRQCCARPGSSGRPRLAICGLSIRFRPGSPW